MNPIFSTALEIQRFCRDRSWSFCFIGGVAIQRWGQPRNTKDVDLTLLTGWDHEPYVVELVRNFAIRPQTNLATILESRVALLSTTRGVPVDIAFGALEFERRTVERSSEWAGPADGSLRTCSAEDLVVHKAFAAREHDWTDIDGILVRQQDRLDLDLVRRELKPLAELKPETDIMPELERRICRSQPPVRRFE